MIHRHAARSLGQVANILCGLLVLPVSRNSIWSLVFGISWEAMIKYHTYLGGAFIITIILHAFVWWKVFDQKVLDYAYTMIDILSYLFVKMYRAIFLMTFLRFRWNIMLITLQIHLQY